MKDEAQLYQVVVTPVYVPVAARPGAAERARRGLSGHCRRLRNQLKQSTGSDFIYSSEGKAMVSTLDPSTTARSCASAPLLSPQAEYAMLATPLIAVDGKQLGELRIARSFAFAQRHLSELRKNLFLIWLVAIGAGILLSYALTRRIVDPIVRLDVAAAAVAAHNYDSRVPVERQDELGRLAVTFNSMCSSIQKAQQELIQQERLATIGHLSTSIVHDLRNPLAAIYGGSEMLVDGELPPPTVKRLANNIYRASRRIQELLQDLVNTSAQSGIGGGLQLARSDRGRLRAARSCGAIQHVDISFDIPETLEAPVERARMERVFFNLCTNSLEALGEGGQHPYLGDPKQRMRHRESHRYRPGSPNASARISSSSRSRRQARRTDSDSASRFPGKPLAHGGDLWSEPVADGASFCLRLPLMKS